MKIVRAITPEGRVIVPNEAVAKGLSGDQWVSLLGGGGNDSRLGKPYAESAWVMRAIKRIAEPIAAVPLTFSGDARGGKKPLVNPDLAAFWERPAQGRSGAMGRADFVEAVVGWLKLKGEAFLVLDDSWLNQRFATKRSRLIIARPDRMRHLVGADGNIVGWQYTDGAGKAFVLLPEQVVHLKFWNPYDEYRGCAEYGGAAVAAEADYLAGIFNLNLMRNNGARGEYVIAKNGMPTDDQRLQITRMLREKHEAARRGINKPAFLIGDISIEEPKVLSPDAQFVAQRLENRHEIFLAFGVPPSMADVMASYSVGSASDRFMLLEETCKPLANGKMADGIEAVSTLFLAGRPTLFASFSFDEHSVMQQVRSERIAAAKDLWDRGMPWQQINDYLGLKMPEFEGWEKGYIPFSVTETGEPRIDVTEQVDAEEATEPGDTGKETSKALDGFIELLQLNTPVARLERTLQLGARTVDKANPLWASHFSKRKAAIKGFQTKFTKVLMGARSETLRKIAAAKNVKAKAVAADLVFELQPFSAQLRLAMRKQAAGTLQKAGQELFAEVKKDDVFAMPSQAALDFLNERENLMKNVADEVFDQVKGSIADGIAAGETMDELAARVRAEFNDLDEGRAETVASTETSAVYGAARQQAMDQAGVQFKQWLTSGLPNVRTAHADANDQIVAADQPFMVGGEALDHPGDPKGSPENVINCHCVAIAVANPESNS